MTSDKLYVADVLYIKLEIVAAIFQVESPWLLEVYEFGLLGSGLGASADPHIPAVQMDRVATIVRMHVVLGLEIEAIALAIDDD